MSKIASKVLMFLVLIGLWIYFGLFSNKQASDWIKWTIGLGVDAVSDNKDTIKKQVWELWGVIDVIAENKESIKKNAWQLTDTAVNTAEKTVKKLGDEIKKSEVFNNYSSTIKSFNKAKKTLERQVYIQEEYKTTFYCGCKFNGKVVDTASCWYETSSKKMAERSKQLEWEHIVPAERFGRSFKQWDEGDSECIDQKGKAFKGRKCVNKTSPEFNAMEADLFNLVPAIGEVNGLRSNFDPIEKNTKEYSPKFGNCDIKIYSRHSSFAPKDDIKGDIARTYLYMAESYPTHMELSEKEKTQFESWDKQDPITKKECTIYKLKSKIMQKTIASYEETCK